MACNAPRALVVLLASLATKNPQVVDSKGAEWVRIPPSPPSWNQQVTEIRRCPRAMACNAGLACGTAVAPCGGSMAVHLHRRHRLNCDGGHAQDSCSGELEERRKG